MKLAVAILTVVMIASITFNTIQWNANLSLTDKNKKEAMAALLIEDASNINSKLQTLDALMSNACRQLSLTGLTGIEAEKILSDLYTENSNTILNAATADKNSILLAIQPSNFSNAIGKDVSNQQQNIEMHQTMQPAVSNLITIVEGFPAVVMVAPIFDNNNQFIGALSIVFQPYDVIYPIVKDSVQGIHTIYALQKNGTLIYDDSPERGKNIFTDQEYQGYPELQTFIHQVVDTKSGYGKYSYYDDLAPARPLVNKEAYWMTIGIYNTDWRLVIARTL